MKTDVNGRLIHLHMPKGTDVGGTTVDKDFTGFLSDLFGFEGIVSFDAMEMLQLRFAFEEAKRRHSLSDKVEIEIPDSVKIAFFTYASESEKYSSKVSVIKNKLMLDKDIFLSFFRKSQTSIVQCIGEVLNSEEVGRVDAILLAGGFCESPVIQTAVKRAFPRDLVLVAPSPSTAVLNGAVLYGHDPDVITARVSAFSYGVGVTDIFREGVHDEAMSFYEEDGRKLCEDVFDVFIRAGDQVPVKTILSPREYFPLATNATSVDLPIYRSAGRNPLCVTDPGCEEIGVIRVGMPDLTGDTMRVVTVRVVVGDTELYVTAEDGNTGQRFSASCDFLSQ